jgi:hypothetical protein
MYFPWPDARACRGRLVRCPIASLATMRLIILSRPPSVVSSDAGWRWVFWVEMIFAGFCTIVSFAFMPETYGPCILQWKARIYIRYV